MNRFWISISLLLLLTPLDLGADIYKCVSDDGVIKYSDEPCSSDAEIVVDTSGQNFDQIIGNARIYSEPVPNSQFHIDDITAHAKKIGPCIITGEINNATYYKGTPGGDINEWYVQLNFGPRSKKRRYVVRMIYKGMTDSGGMQVWLDSFSVRKNGKLHDPRSVLTSKIFIHRSKGRWKVRR